MLRNKRLAGLFSVQSEHHVSGQGDHFAKDDLEVFVAARDLLLHIVL